MSKAAEVIAAHRQVGPTKFGHRGGSSYVEYPKCGCGERMHPQAHAQHVADKLAEAGLLDVDLPQHFSEKVERIRSKSHRFT